MDGGDKKLGVQVKEFHKALRLGDSGDEEEFNSLLYWLYHHPGITTPQQLAQLETNMQQLIQQQRALEQGKKAFVQTVRPLLKEFGHSA